MADLLIAARPSYEFLLGVTAFVTPHRVDSYDLGPTWFADAAALGRAATEGLRALTSGCEHVFVRLLSTAHDLPAPGDVSDLMARLEAMSADDLRLTLLGYYSKRPGGGRRRRKSLRRRPRSRRAALVRHRDGRRTGMKPRSARSSRHRRTIFGGRSWTGWQAGRIASSKTRSPRSARSSSARSTAPAAGR